jgi:hypothetical protein
LNFDPARGGKKNSHFWYLAQTWKLMHWELGASRMAVRSPPVASSGIFRATQSGGSEQAARMASSERCANCRGRTVLL